MSVRRETRSAIGGWVLKIRDRAFPRNGFMNHMCDIDVFVRRTGAELPSS